MRPEDLDTVSEVERRAYPFPWSRGNFADSLASGYSAWTCHDDDGMVGHALLMLVQDEAHLLNLTIRPERQREGLGSIFLEHLFAVARGHGALRMLLEVRPSNAAGRALYERFGFAQIGRRRGYYPGHGGREDALVLAKAL
jgi:ribosomal-protein-alanine N-acetyltransferase